MTVLHVTHDFIEAGTLGDLAMVLDSGRLSQVGTPDTIFRKPASAAVADFIGAENVYSGTIARVETASNDDIAALTFYGNGLTLVGVGDHPGGAGHAVIRGEDVVLARQHPNPSSARNVIEGRIVEVAPNGVLACVCRRLRRNGPASWRSSRRNPRHRWGSLSANRWWRASRPRLYISADAHTDVPRRSRCRATRAAVWKPDVRMKVGLAR